MIRDPQEQKLIAFLRNKETADKAAKLIQVEYEVLPHIHTIEEAAKPDAPKVFDEEENNILQ